MGTEGYTYYPFCITINDCFRHEVDKYKWNSEYHLYINNLTEEVLREINANINLRVGKWDILDYLSVLKVNLNKIRNGYYEIQNDNVETNCRKLYVNPCAKISSSDDVLLNTQGTTEWINFVLTDFWKIQMNSIDVILKYINERETIIEKTDDYVKVIAEIPVINRTLSWEANDTDLLELITALVESGSIQNSTKSITRKEAI